jgi:hypothetical protein
MFQYAFALSLKEKFPNEDVYIDTQHYHSFFFKHFRGINLHNGFEIEKVFPNASIPIARCKDLLKISYYIPNYILSRIGRKILPVRASEMVLPFSKTYSYIPEVYNQEDCYFEGFWQNIRYFESIKDKLMDVYAHPKPNEYNESLIGKISSQDSVGIHVRRGDYLSEPDYKGICDLEYYKRAIERLKEAGKKYCFYIFSNDIAWCKENLEPLMEGYLVFYVTENKGKNSCWDMFLMTYCKNLIIANSSFSWWGAFLNKNVKRVIAPCPWVNRDCEIELYGPTWEKL